MNLTNEFRGVTAQESDALLSQLSQQLKPTPLVSLEPLGAELGFYCSVGSKRFASLLGSALGCGKEQTTSG